MFCSLALLPGVVAGTPGAGTPGVVAGTPARELLFAAAPTPEAPAPTPEAPIPEGKTGCERSPCVGWVAGFTCVDYPNFRGVNGQSCRACINDPSLPHPWDPSTPTDCSVTVSESQLSGCDPEIKITDPPECCIYGGPFADSTVHQIVLGALPNTTGLAYGVKVHYMSPEGFSSDLCYIHKKVLTEIGDEAGYHPEMVPTVFSSDKPSWTMKGVGMRNDFCHTETNGVPAPISQLLAAKGNVKWAYDCAPDDPFPHVKAEVVEATAFIASSPAGGCRWSKYGEERCDNPTEEYKACAEAEDDDKCETMREAQWAAWKASKASRMVSKA